MAVHCAVCGEKLGFLSTKVNYQGRIYCRKCYAKLVKEKKLSWRAGMGSVREDYPEGSDEDDGGDGD